MSGFELWITLLPISIALGGIWSELSKMNKTKER